MSHVSHSCLRVSRVPQCGIPSRVCCIPVLLCTCPTPCSSVSCLQQPVLLSRVWILLWQYRISRTVSPNYQVVDHHYIFFLIVPTSPDPMQSIASCLPISRNLFQPLITKYVQTRILIHFTFKIYSVNILLVVINICRLRHSGHIVHIRKLPLGTKMVDSVSVLVFSTHPK